MIKPHIIDDPHQDPDLWLAVVRHLAKGRHRQGLEEYTGLRHRLISFELGPSLVGRARCACGVVVEVHGADLLRRPMPEFSSSIMPGGCDREIFIAPTPIDPATRKSMDEMVARLVDAAKPAFAKIKRKVDLGPDFSRDFGGIIAHPGSGTKDWHGIAVPDVTFEDIELGDD